MVAIDTGCSMVAIDTGCSMVAIDHTFTLMVLKMSVALTHPELDL